MAKGKKKAQQEGPPMPAELRIGEVVKGSCHIREEDGMPMVSLDLVTSRWDSALTAGNWLSEAADWQKRYEHWKDGVARRPSASTAQPTEAVQ